MQFFLQRVCGMVGAAELKDFTWLNDDNATGGAASNIRDVDTWEDDSESAESDVSDLRLDNTDVPESDMATAAEVN
jgi:N-acetylmuramic acid 6-phosphate (MurNAc-6-P) etherase